MSTTLPTKYPMGGSMRRPVRWWTLTRGDIDATIVQLGFNIALFLMPVFMLVPLGMSMSFCMSHLIPGYALGFAIGSFGLTWLGISLARRENRDTVTAHVYGANVPAIVAYTLGIIMPVYLQTHDPVVAWQAGAAAVIFSGLIKLIAAPFAATIDRLIPLPAVMTVFAAAMYTYIALVILQRTFQHPIIGILALTLVSITSLSNLKVTRWAIPPFLFVWLGPGLCRHRAWLYPPGLEWAVADDAVRAVLGAAPGAGHCCPLSLRHRSHDHLSDPAGHRVRRRGEGRRRCLSARPGTRLGRDRHVGVRAGRQHRDTARLCASSALQGGRRPDRVHVLDGGSSSSRSLWPASPQPWPRSFRGKSSRPSSPS